MQVMYRQCSMQKVINPATHLRRTSWLPEKFAATGQPVKLKNKQGDWDDGWVVASIGNRLEPEQAVAAYSRAHLKQRKASDI